MKKKKSSTESSVCVDGFMTFGEGEKGLRSADFMCLDDVAVEPFNGKCRVQIMRDGNVYVTELPRRIRNRAIFREDNASLSHGRDGRWYFCFSLDDSELEQLPGKLVQQTSAIAGKVIRDLISKS